jgi:hypothetical protein
MLISCTHITSLPVALRVPAAGSLPDCQPFLPSWTHAGEAEEWPAGRQPQQGPPPRVPASRCGGVSGGGRGAGRHSRKQAQRSNRPRPCPSQLRPASARWGHRQGCQQGCCRTCWARCAPKALDGGVELAEEGAGEHCPWRWWHCHGGFTH